MATIATPWTTLLAGDPCDSNQLITYLNTISNDYNGNISNVNIASAAAIAGSKLAALGVGTTQLADLGVTTAKIANLAVTTAKINTAAVVDSTIDWTTGAAVRAARIPQGVNYKIVMGQKSVATTASPTQDIAIVFTADGTPVPTAFSSATNLQVVATAQGTNSADVFCCQIKGNPTTTGFTVTVFTADGANLSAKSTPIIVRFVAVGPA